MMENKPVAGERIRFVALGLVAAGVVLLAVLVFAFLGRHRSPPAQSGQTAAVPLLGGATAGTPPARSIGDETAVTAAVSETSMIAEARPGTIEFAAAADQAMATLLDRPAASGDLGERLANQDLVLRAAEEAGGTMPLEEAARLLQQFLAENGKTMADLSQALTESGISPDDFVGYYGRLVLVDRFSRTQAQTRGITVNEYLLLLRQSASATPEPTSEGTPPAGGPHELAPVTRAPRPLPGPTATVPALAAATLDAATAARGTDPGQLAPDFRLPALNYPAGETMSFDDLLGRPVLLSFWTTWCPHCQRLTPVLVEAFGHFAEREVYFVGVNVEESPESVQRYLQTNAIPYPVLLDAAGQTAVAYRVSGFPTTYFLDSQGRIVGRHIGEMSPEQVDQYFAALTNETSQAD